MINQEVTFKEFEDEFIGNNKLKPKSCLPTCIEEVCGGWSQETFKQHIQKLTKKGTNPLPLWFDSPEAMEVISNKAQALQDLFKLLDTKKKGRIDTCEFFAVVTLTAAGDFPTKLGNIIDIFGGEKPNAITPNEMHYFLDSLFRGLFKILITAKNNAPSNPDRRMAEDEIKRMLVLMFKDLDKVPYLMKDELIKNLTETSDDMKLFRALDKLQEALQSSIIYARDQAILTMKIRGEVKKRVYELIGQIEKELAPKK